MTAEAGRDQLAWNLFHPLMPSVSLKYYFRIRGRRRTVGRAVVDFVFRSAPSDTFHIDRGFEIGSSRYEEKAIFARVGLLSTPASSLPILLTLPFVPLYSYTTQLFTTAASILVCACVCVFVFGCMSAYLSAGPCWIVSFDVSLNVTFFSLRKQKERTKRFEKLAETEKETD